MAAIVVENLTKTYKLYDKHVDRVKEAFHPLRKKYHRPFNALTDVTFHVQQGETIGIIGRNGSGKSTLLQIICGILTPTAGRVEVDGRLSALLELGAGFNPEYSGRQNAYINGAILGLSHEEVDERFDEIMAFADIGSFIDQPVKSYSSGMVVRLAFAVAISIDPDILVIDEALSVGDEAFQRKCFSRIRQIQENGGTILFVSHAAGSVVELCHRAILLDEGMILIAGTPKEIVSRYHRLIFAPPDKVAAIRAEWLSMPDRMQLAGEDAQCRVGRDEDDPDASAQPLQQAFYAAALQPKSTVRYEPRGARIEDPHIVTLSDRRVNMLVSGDCYIYQYHVWFERPAFNVRFGMLVKTISGIEIGGHVSAAPENGIACIDAGSRLLVQFRFRCALNPGVYFLNAGVLGVINGDEIYLDRQMDAAMFRVQDIEGLLSTCLVNLDIGCTVSRGHAACPDTPDNPDGSA